MPAAQKLLIDSLMAGAAVPGCELDRDDKPMIILFFLARGGLMAIQAVDPLLRV